MRRVDVPELMDQPWCPAWLRDAMTDGIRAAEQVGRPFDVLLPRLEALLAEADTPRLVDLCSGGGGPAVHLFDVLRARGAATELVLTDLHPNRVAFAEAERLTPGVRGLTAPVDATDVPADLPGVRTVFNAFHHLPEPVASAVLRDAARRRQPFLAVEALAATPLGFATAWSAAAIALFAVPFAPPLRLRRLLLGALFPLAPVALVWEGTASCLRCYGLDGWRRLVDGLGETPGYRFEMGVDPVGMPPVRLTWLVGRPVGGTDAPVG